MNLRKFTQVATIIFALVAVFHALRLFNGWGVAVYTFEIPLWWSFIGLAAAGFLAWTGYALWKK